MGHRAYLSVHTLQKEEEVFEANNFLPFFWISLLKAGDITAILPVWRHYEALCMDEAREEELERFTDNWPSPCSIKIAKEALRARAEAAALFFRQAIPGYTRLYDDFVKYLLSLLPGTGDHILLDIIAIAAFSDVQHFTAGLEKTIKGINERDIKALGNLDTAPVMLTGFPVDHAFALTPYPALKTLQDDLKKQRGHALAELEKKQRPRKHNLLPVAGILLGLFLAYASSRGYKKEGMTFMVVSVHISGWLLLLAGLYGLSRKRG